jgi:hypothetical protein
MAAIADDILDAEISYREGKLDDAFASLRDGAVAKFDALPYDEPHGWLMSPRQTLGALLTEQGRAGEAIRVYEEDLVLFPKNIWSLTGLKICLTGGEAGGEGGGEGGEASGGCCGEGGGSKKTSIGSGGDGDGDYDRLREVEALLAEAAKGADVKVGASCACALENWATSMQPGT